MRILLTNDDSHDSPLFWLAIDVLREFGELVIAVPAEEQSWKGKAMTRYEPLYVQPTEIHGHPAWSITGTPADCTNLAIYNLMDEAPDVVVSGINIGVNVGLGLLLASGTVGACLEANIARLPALALSQHLDRDEFGHWDRHRELPEATTTRLREHAAPLLRRVWARFLAECPAGQTWSVNLPNRPGAATRLVDAYLGRTFYRRCFERHGDQYRHKLAPFEGDPDPRADGNVVRAGHVSITVIDLEALAPPPNGAFR